MFNRFCAWLEEEHLRFEQCETGHFIEFLNAENLNLPVKRRHTQASRQRQQYMLILERVYAHLGTLGLAVTINPGKELAKTRDHKGQDKPTKSLAVAERHQLIAHVQAKLDELRRNKKQLERWIEYRDLALIGATVGGGMKLGQLTAMTLNCIKLDEGVLDNSSTAHSHRAPLLPFARDILADWVGVLAALGAEATTTSGRAGGTPAQWRNSRLVFIADRSSNGYGRFATTRGMHPSSIFRRIQGVLEEAGITGARASAQTLRNTYAALLIEGGATNLELVTSLGLTTETTAQRLRNALSARPPGGAGGKPEDAGVR